MWGLATGPWAPARVPRATPVPRANGWTARTTARGGESAPPSARYFRMDMGKIYITVVREAFPRLRRRYIYALHLRSVCLGLDQLCTTTFV